MDVVTRNETLPLTPRAKQVIRWAAEEAKRRGHEYVGTEHLLFGLAHEHEGEAYRILTERGISESDISTAMST